MLQIKVKSRELYDEANNRFVEVSGGTLKLEHSLASVSEWESIFHKPFLSEVERTYDETMEYIKCMTLNRDDIDDSIYDGLTSKDLEKILDYIKDSKTATWFSDANKKRPSRKVITSEVIYYDMITSGVPFECQYWHLNRLMTLIRVCGEKATPNKKKMSRDEVLAKYRQINEERCRKHNTRG